MDEINFIEIEETPVEEKPEEKKPRGSRSQREHVETELDVRSAWPCPFNDIVLIYSGEDYRLIGVNDWPRNMKFKLNKSFFENLSVPTLHSEDLKQNIALWKQGLI